LGNEHVLELFPQLGVLTKVDLDSDLAAFLVGYILDSGHGIPSRSAISPDLTLLRVRFGVN
jgi:hypothetical protein